MNNTDTEKTHEMTCRQCGQVVLVDTATYEHYENNKATGVGFTEIKCFSCWT